jgi:hypothetical protein
MSEEHPQVYFLPWAEIPGSVRIGPVTFWPYLSESSQRIGDEQIRQFLDKYFDCFVGHEGRPRNWVTICSYGDEGFRALDEEERKELRSTVDVLAFIEIAPKIKQAVCANNKSMGPPNADTFELYNRAIDLENPGIFIRTSNRIEIYFDPDSLIFAQPYTVGPSLWDLDDHLIEGFSRCFSLKEQVLPIFRSLEWFRMAHGSMGPMGYFSPFTALVMMAIAFEILLELPDPSTRKDFVNRVEGAIKDDYFKRGERQKKNDKLIEYSLAGCWAWDFYTLRSKIVHGDELPRTELIFKDWVSHISVAGLVFYELVLRKLFELGCIGEEVLSCAEAFEEAITNGKGKMPVEPVLRWYFGFNDIHRALGWID